MTSSARYGLWSSVVAACGLPLVGLAFHETHELRWGFLGWGVMVAAGVTGGMWLVVRHGQPGSGFVVALGVSMGARFLLSAAGGAAAAAGGRDRLWAYVVGLGAGYIPLQVFEMAWFLRSARGAIAPRCEAGRR